MSEDRGSSGHTVTRLRVSGWKWPSDTERASLVVTNGADSEVRQPRFKSWLHQLLSEHEQTIYFLWALLSPCVKRKINNTYNMYFIVASNDSIT